MNPIDPRCEDCGGPRGLRRQSPVCATCARERIRKQSLARRMVPCSGCQTPTRQRRLDRPARCASCYDTMRREARVQSAAVPATGKPYLADIRSEQIEARYRFALARIKRDRPFQIEDALLGSSLHAVGSFIKVG